MATLAKMPVRMSVSDFLRWESQDGLRYELVDGEPRAMAPASTPKSLILRDTTSSVLRGHRRW